MYWKNYYGFHIHLWPFFSPQAWLLEQIHPVHTTVGSSWYGQELGEKGKRKQNRSSVKECIFIGKLFWLSALIRVSFCSLGFCFRQLLSSWNQNQILILRSHGHLSHLMSSSIPTLVRFWQIYQLYYMIEMISGWWALILFQIFNTFDHTSFLIAKI